MSGNPVAESPLGTFTFPLCPPASFPDLLHGWLPQVKLGQKCWALGQTLTFTLW